MTCAKYCPLECLLAVFYSCQYLAFWLMGVFAFSGTTTKHECGCPYFQIFTALNTSSTRTMRDNLQRCLAMTSATLYKLQLAQCDGAVAAAAAASLLVLLHIEELVLLTPEILHAARSASCTAAPSLRRARACVA